MMPRFDPSELRLTRETLKKNKAFTLPMLSEILKCSSRTAQTKLKMWRTYTSYNKNGKYYTFPEIPRFDENGIWKYQGIAFSRHGNLKKTVIHLVSTSTSGLSGSELGNILGLAPQSFVHHFRDCPGIRREKHDGVYIHFSDHPDKHKQQVKRRIDDLIQVIKKDTITEGDAIIILVAIIRHYGIDLEEILVLPEIKKSRLSRSAIQNFIESHDLLKKKSGYKALKLFRTYVNKLLLNVSSNSLFPQKPTIYFYPEIEYCLDCGVNLNIRKTTQKKTVVTMDIGAFWAKETQLECSICGAVYFSEELRNPAPAHCTFGFDIIEYVGKALFLSSRNNREIMDELASKNVTISEREVSFLSQKFIIYLALAHQESNDKLRSSMSKRGGYILHVDGTCEGNSPHLFCGLDGISEIVLGAIKAPSEKKEELIPFFRRLKEQYGIPIALVHDMGVAIIGAIEVVFPGIADFICHFHFLRDIGKDLLLQDYQAIMNRLKKNDIRGSLRRKANYLKGKIDNDAEMITEFSKGLENGTFSIGYLRNMPDIATYCLIKWVLVSSHQLQGYGFPFDRIHLDFFLRLKELHRILRDINDVQLDNKAKKNGPFIRVWKSLDEVMQDKELIDAVTNIEAKVKVFDKLRKALRIALPEGKNGLNDEGDEMCIKTIENEMTKFIKWIQSDKERKITYAKMIEQIEKYWSKLFADPITVNTPYGPTVICPQRTNNILERFFRKMKRLGRKKSGTASLNKMLKSILADTPLVRNLENKEYIDIILNSCTTMAERFSQIDAKLVREQLKEARKNEEKIPGEVRKIISMPDLPNKISALFCSTTINLTD